MNSIKCPHCGYMPDIEFARKCPNLNLSKCMVTGITCKFTGAYQTCPIKNEIESECGY